MRWLQTWYPDVRVARIALAAGAVAGLVVIAACTDSGGRSITAPPQAPRLATIFSGGFTNAKLIKLCVDASSPAGNYTFVNTVVNRNVALDGFSTALPGNGSFNGVKWFDPGDGGEGTAATNAAQGVNYTVAAGSCITVLTRSVGDPAFMASLPVNQGGNGQGGVNDAFSAVTITYTGVNTAVGGANYNHTDCLLDDGVLIPQRANPPGSFQTWGSGGIAFNHLSPSTYICDQNNPIRAFANYEHGAQVTFFFAAPPTTGHNCTFTQGYYKNHETYTASVLSSNLGTTYITAGGLLKIGAYQLSAAQIDDILGSAVGHGYNSGGVTFTKDQLSMIHQLITAELNVAGGASPATIAATITAANNYTAASKSQLSTWTNTLDTFNNGGSGPAHCS